MKANKEKEYKMIRTGLALAFGAVAAVAAAAPVPLAGRAVAVPSDAERSTRLAATELTNYLFRITGKASEIACVADGDSPAIVVGTVKTLGDAVPSAACAALAKTDDIEASWTGTDGGKVWIVGKSEVAELYATYHFLESKLGVRWFQAWRKEDPGDYVPTDATPSVAEFSEFREPAFKIRRIELMRSNGNVPATNAQTCAVRNGFQVKPPYTGINFKKPTSPNDVFYAPRMPRKLQYLGGDHGTFASTCPEKKWFATHPEYFALVGGKRRPGWQYCISNPGLRQAVADRIIGLLDRNDGNGWWGFGMVDTTYGWCECDACRALDAADKPFDGMPTVSSRFFDTVNDISAKVWTKYPKADLRTWAYHTYRPFPTGVVPDHRLKVCFCDHMRCYGHALDDPRCPRNVKICNLLKTWTERMPYVFVYCYLFCTEAFYSCSEYGMIDDIRKYAKMGVKGWKEEGVFSDSKWARNMEFVGGEHRVDSFPSIWQTLYVTGHMMWDPTIDGKALIDDAEEKYYGAAYPAMKEYHGFRRKLWAESNACMGYPRGDQRRPILLDVPGAKERLLSLLDRAEGLAVGDPVRLFRVSRDRYWLTKYWIKPNEKIKKKMEKAIYAPRTVKKVTIDGVGDEDAWNDAFTVPGELLLGMRTKKPVEESIKTTIKVMHDDANIYFLMTALEPAMSEVKMHSRRGDIVWADDGMEVLLYPPAIDNAFYHLGMTPAGGICAERSEKITPGEFGAEHAGKMYSDRYVIELRVPVNGIYPLKDGEMWKVSLGRDRPRHKGFPVSDTFYTIDGRKIQDSSAWHPFIIGSKK